MTTNHPLWRNRLDGHMALANSAALKAANSIEHVRELEGDAIVCNSKGNLTGMFKDLVMNLIDPIVPPASEELEDLALDAAMTYVAEGGVTSAYNMIGYMNAFERAHATKRLKTCVYAGMALDQW